MSRSVRPSRLHQLDVVRDEPMTLGAGREPAASAVALGEQSALPDGRVPHRASEIDRKATTVRHDDDGGLAHPTQRRRRQQRLPVGGSEGCPSRHCPASFSGIADGTVGLRLVRGPGIERVEVGVDDHGEPVAMAAHAVATKDSATSTNASASARSHGVPLTSSAASSVSSGVSTGWPCSSRTIDLARSRAPRRRRTRRPAARGACRRPIRRPRCAGAGCATRSRTPTAQRRGRCATSGSPVRAGRLSPRGRSRAAGPRSRASRPE